MANNFYLQPQNEPEIFYELHATTQVSVTFASTLTSYPIETGAVVTENIVISPVVVSFTGILTDVKQSAGFSPISLLANLLTEDQGTPNKLTEYIEDLRIRQFKKELFRVYFSGIHDELSSIDLAVITNFSINKDPSLGTSWLINIEMQQVRLADPAITEPIPGVDFNDLLAGNAAGSANPAGVDNAQAAKFREGVNLRQEIADPKNVALLK